MIVDIKDIEHVYNEVINEINPLLQKRKLMRTKIAKQLKSKAPNHIRNFTTYKRPGGNITWTIYYDIPIGLKADEVEFLFITSVETKKRKVFINLNTRVQGKVPPKDLLRIFDIHFLERFKERCVIKAKNYEELLAIFRFDGEISIFNSWDKQSDEMRYLNHWGFSLGRYDELNCIVYFDTFVSKDMLFDKQKKWVSELLNDAIKESDYKECLLMYKYWHDFMDEDAMIDEIIKQTGQSKILYNVEKREVMKKWLASYLEEAKKKRN
jgi:hypothetical protein